MKILNTGIQGKNYFFAFLLFMPLIASAQNQFNLNELGDGQLILNLSASEQTSVQQDTLNVLMQYTAQGRDSTALQDEVNQAMREALAILEKTNNNISGKIFVRGDSDLDYGRIMNVVKIINAAGFTQVVLVTQVN